MSYTKEIYSLNAKMLDAIEYDDQEWYDSLMREHAANLLEKRKPIEKDKPVNTNKCNIINESAKGESHLSRISR